MELSTIKPSGYKAQRKENEMSWNMPDGATSDQYDRYCGYDQPDEEEIEYEEPEPEENEIEVITEAEALEALAEEAGDRAYDAAEEERLFPEPARIGPQQGRLFEGVA
jgi:hypothetical protein